MGFGTICASDPSGNAAMCPGYTGSPLVCPDQDGNLVLAGLQSYTWSCLTPVWDMIFLLEMIKFQALRLKFRAIVSNQLVASYGMESIQSIWASYY